MNVEFDFKNDWNRDPVGFTLFQLEAIFGPLRNCDFNVMVLGVGFSLLVQFATDVVDKL